MPNRKFKPLSTAQMPTSSGLRHALKNTIHLDSSAPVSQNKTEDGRFFPCSDEREDLPITGRQRIGDEFKQIWERRRRAREAFDHIAEEREKSQREAFEDPVRASELNRKYLEANHRLIRAESEYEAFITDLAEVQSIAGNGTSGWSDSASHDEKTLEELQREAAAAESRVRERYEADLMQAADARLELANENLGLMQKLKKAIARVEELESEIYDLHSLVREATEKFAELGYTWMHGTESHGVSFL